MRTFTTLAAAAVLTLSTGFAFAGEGNGNPFPSQSPARPMQGVAFVTDTGSAAYPTASGNRQESSSLSQLVPTPSNERIVQSYVEAGAPAPVG